MNRAQRLRSWLLLALVSGGLLTAWLTCRGWEPTYRWARRVRQRLFPPPTPAPPAAVHEAQVLPRRQRPNIILVVTDDLDATLGTMDTMSVLQGELIAKGLVWEPFFVSVSVCCPARATILRGQYAHNHGIYTTSPPAGGHPAVRARAIEASTLPLWLQQAGYKTALIGKYYNFYPPGRNRLYIPPGWDEWYVPSKGRPFEGFDFALNENGHEIEYWGEDAYLTDVLADKALDVLTRFARRDQPFFLYLATYAPHKPAVPAPRHAHLFLDVRAPRTPAFNEEDIRDKPPHLRATPLLTAEEIAALDDLYRRRLQTMQAVDEMLARIVAFLDAQGLWENTYLFFTSDNGYHLGQHRLRAGKGGPYEDDMRVPLVVRGPHIPPGVRVQEALAGNVDLAPTIADLAGVQPPPWVDGRSLVPWLFAPENGPDRWRQGYLYVFYGYREPDPSPAPHFLGVRTQTYVYVEYADGTREVYDLQRDPYQLDNLAAQAPLEFLNQVSDWVHALAQCQAAECRHLEERTPPVWKGLSTRP